MSKEIVKNDAVSADEDLGPLKISDETAVKVDDVSILFNLNKEGVDSFKEYIIKMLKHQLHYDEFWALTDVSFELKKGERLGILGLNGAGKSTLLKTIAGVLKPSKGSVTVRGVIAPLLELGAGFDSQYTGKENIFLYGAVMGYSREFIATKYDQIVEFSELEKFIDVPLKNYSSGMKARLGFAIATAVEPEVLILDEVLSVGDAKFRAKSEAKVRSMFDHGVTVLFVSHSVEQVKSICNKAILLEHGKITASGTTEEVCAIYEEKTGKGLDSQMQDVVKELKKAQNKIEKIKEKSEQTGEEISDETMDNLEFKLEDLQQSLGREANEDEDSDDESGSPADKDNEVM